MNCTLRLSRFPATAPPLQRPTQHNLHEHDYAHISPPIRAKFAYETDSTVSDQAVGHFQHHFHHFSLQPQSPASALENEQPPN